MSKKKANAPTSNTIALNKKAKHEYHIEERFEAGLALLGWEVKSLRAGKAQLVDAYVLLKDGEVVTIAINTEDGMPLSVEMPASVILEVTHTEPGVKGNTATNATKPATVETGARINVPLFINEGDKIKVDTEKGIYQERMKE